MKTKTKEELEAELLDLRLQVLEAKERGDRKRLIETVIERDKIERDLLWMDFERCFLEV